MRLLLVCLLAGPLATGPAAAQDQVESDVTCILHPRELVHLGSAVSGLLVAITAERGDPVRKGQVLARLESSVEEATLALSRFRATNDAAILAERAEFDMLRHRVDRTRPLAESRIAPVAALEEAQAKMEESRNRIRAAEMDKAMAALEAERAVRQLALRDVRSPIDGVVTERKLSAGEFVYEQTPIMTLAQIDPLNVEVVVSAALYGSLKVGQVVQIRLAQPIGTARAATIEVVDPVIDAASSTFGLRLLLPNPKGEIPAGLRCDIEGLKPVRPR